jgi:hypothetical protein
MSGSAPLLDEDRALQPASEPVGGLAVVIERLAANPSVDVAKLEKIIELQERILKHQAEEAFNVAFAEMQAVLPTIAERGKTDKGTYARLEDIIEQVRPVLSQHGFSLSHRTEWPDKQTVKVVGILTHRAGHSRQSEFMASADQSGSKNAIQALGSSVAYGRRYTTKDLLNIATRDEDDDGASHRKPGAPEPPKGYEEWLEGMTAVADEGTARLQKTWTDSKPQFRAYITRHAAPTWARLKAKAAKVSA